MLPLQLVRARTRNGELFPQFCISDDDLQLARVLINIFNQSAEGKEKKRLLDARLSEIESQYDDYKLVRGLATLLERRCHFRNAVDIPKLGDNNKNARSDDYEQSINHNIPTIKSNPKPIPDPSTIRKDLFEESSKMGFALTDFERDEVIANVAAKIGLSSIQIQEIMWSDLEENMILDQIDLIEPEELAGWYNLSQVQTLLFNCTNLEFSVQGGANWKRVLRNLKRLGLMYNLKERLPAHAADSIDSDSKDSGLTCSVDGPLSLFKLTDRYGTSIAKLLPSIVSSEGEWTIDSSIVKKTMSGRKVFRFKLSSSEVPTLWDPYFDYYRTNKAKMPTLSNSATLQMRTPSHYYDSSVEEKFAKRFEQSANGWKLIREPDPIVVSGGRAFIPDFMFEKYGKKVYLEIVGFWTAEYLERKMKKIADTVSSNNVILFIAVNNELACTKIASKMSSSSPSSPSIPSWSSIIPSDRIILYKNDSVPIKMIVNYLRAIDEEQIEQNTNNPNLRINFDPVKHEIVSIESIASELNIPVESAIKIALRDNQSTYLKAGNCFISKSKVDKLAPLIRGVTTFNEACAILLANSIPESCHAELVSMLGYDVVWQSLDSSRAIIVKR